MNWWPLGVAVLILIFGVILMIRIVPEYKRVVVLRLGRVLGAKGPGVIVIFPVIDQPVTVDLRETYLEIPRQTCITKDNAPISIDFLIYSKVVEPMASVIQVRDYAGAAMGIATTTLRAVVGDIPLDDVLAKREQINQVLRTKLDEVTERWGVKVTTVEIREITPPKDVQEAMNKQMAAERSRRAAVLEADGQKQANITVAEGEKQSAILKAEGTRQAAILNAEGYALALSKIFEAAKNVDGKTMSLQYLEALKSLGASPATKFVIPTELTALLAPFAGLVKSSTESAR
ncbi:MAG: SPFH/Band 7/PHB domain protein [Candidatus Omnitrophica bacterium]|nr:SPFH/Band 7/PHB domain protein [Candidatus Omnitrophota bacterium]